MAVRRPSVLLFGGLGYIGSHVATVLQSAGWKVTLFDNLSNSKRSAVKGIEAITGQAPQLIEGSALDSTAVARAFDDVKPDVAVLLFGLKDVVDSLKNPVPFFETNVYGAFRVIQAAQNANCKKLIFSSSASIYGVPQYLPIDESHPIRPDHTYGQTKAMVETMLKRVSTADPSFQTIILRYFNPVGAHPSALIGEDPILTPTHLFPRIAEVVTGRREKLMIHGSDFRTIDGSAMRDFVHIMDVAEAHGLACQAMTDGRVARREIFNVGTGKGNTVLEVLNAWSHTVGRELPYELAPRRAGDPGACYANAGLIAARLGWRAKRDLNEMAADHWQWSQKSVNGQPQTKPPHSSKV